MSLFKPRTKDGNFLFSVVLTTAKMLFIVLLILGISGTGALMGVAKAWIETAPPLDMSAFDAHAKTSFIYDKNGELITDFKGTENRIDATIEEIPLNLKNAIIAIEDQRFMTHNGVDVRRIMSAFLGNLLNNRMQGGSTITQQLIKLTMLTSDQNYKRKLQEAYLALELETKFTKDEIVLEYLNVIYLGGSNYGVKVAALDYFGKDVSQLTLRECAALAGAVRDPTKYN
ncbi:MAG: biosynthetic peptidoglycan transglycosylase, partial [Clostridia bacterium]